MPAKKKPAKPRTRTSAPSRSGRSQKKAAPRVEVSDVSPAHDDHLRAEPAPPTRAMVVSHKEQMLIQWMKSNPVEVINQRKEMLEKLAKRRCSYGRDGGTMPITLTPLFMSQSSIDWIARIGEMFDRIIDKVVDLYRDDAYVRSQFRYNDIPSEWLDWDPGYNKPTVLNRHDALFDGKDLKFIEFNTDNPGGRAWCDTLEDIFRSYPMYQDLIANFSKAADRPMLRDGLKALLDCYRNAGGTKEKPRIAIVSFKEYLPGSDNEITRDYFVENGFDTHCIDSRDFEYHHGKLHSGRLEFDLLNIALRFVFFKRFPRENRDFLAAIKDRAAIAVNPWRATIGAQKEAMSFISNPANHRYFTEEEQKCIRDHLPWTRRLDETITMSPDGSDISLGEYMIKNRERLVLKPCWGAGGHDVKVGKTTEVAEWEAYVRDTLGCSWWIVQDACNIPEYEMPILRERKVVLEKKFLNINPYIFNGKYAGCLGRMSGSNVVNVSSGGGGIIPIFPLNEG